jgi:hypothetical protein
MRKGLAPRPLGRSCMAPVVHNAAVLITVAGVPAHPILVHAVVLLIPLAAGKPIGSQGER